MQQRVRCRSSARWRVLDASVLYERQATQVCQVRFLSHSVVSCCTLSLSKGQYNLGDRPPFSPALTTRSDSLGPLDALALTKGRVEPATEPRLSGGSPLLAGRRATVKNTPR